MGSQDEDWARRQKVAKQQHEERMRALQDRIDRTLKDGHDRAMKAIKQR
jgi:hypothetical protein